MPFLLSFILIFVAELGDKTQLLTLGFAAKYPLKTVIFAISIATALLMAVAVILGGTINAIIPPQYMQALAGIIFIVFGLWTISGNDQDEHELKKEGRAATGIFWIIFSSFFLAELGDKTQLSAFVLSAQFASPIFVWLGATLGMISVNVLAAILGNYLKGILSETMIKLAGGIVFILFGIAAIWSVFYL